MFIFLFVLLLVVLAGAVYNSNRITTLRNEMDTNHEETLERTGMFYETIMKELNTKMALQRNLLDHTYSTITAMSEYSAILNSKLDAEIESLKEQYHLLDIGDTVQEETTA